MREKRETELKMSAMHTSWYEEAHGRAVNWDDKKRQLFIAMKRFICVTFTEQTRKRLNEIPEYKQWLEKLEAKQKRVCNKRSTAMARFAVSDSVAGAVSDVANEMLHGISADTSPEKRMEAVVTNAKARGLTMPQIFGFFLGRSVDEALKMEMTEAFEEELHRVEVTKEQFGDALQRLDKTLFSYTPDELDALVAAFDTDASGTVSLPEFRDWCFRIPTLTWKTARKAHEDAQLALLAAVPLLVELKPTALRRMLVSMTTEFYTPGEYVMRQGDTEDRSLFIVVGGTANATRDELNVKGEKAGEKVVGAIKEGAFFGESALLNQEPRTANVIATSKMRCARLEQEMYERILEDIEAQIKVHAEACFAANTTAELIQLYDAMWRPKLSGAGCMYEVKMFLLNGVREEGAVLIAAYNKSTKQRCGVMFIDAKSALSLTSPMELREAQKLKQKSAGLAAKKPGARASSKGAKGLKDMAKMALARLELQKQVERECLTKALLMRFLVNNKTGMLMCRPLRGDFSDQKVAFLLDENPGFPDAHIEDLFVSVETGFLEEEEEPAIGSGDGDNPPSTIPTEPAEIAAE